jgi:serine/threonine protein kinase
MGRAEEAVGTWSYLAPEYKHNGRSSSKTDTYAFGLSMLQLLTAASQTQELVHRCQTALEACNLHQVCFELSIRKSYSLSQLLILPAIAHMTFAREKDLRLVVYSGGGL